MAATVLVNHALLKVVLGPIAICIALIVGPVVFLLSRPERRELRLRRNGIDLLLAGNPTEAETRFRACLAIHNKLPQSQRVRALVCLADSLIDQDRLTEARTYLDEALALNDETGSGQGSMADLLLRQRSDQRKAIEMADQAFHFNSLFAAARYPAGISDHCIKLRQVVCWSRKAEAFAQLGDRQAAREEVDRACQVLLLFEPHFKAENLIRIQEMDAHWHLALAQLSLGDTNKAVDQLRLARDLDPKGKYRALAQQRLTQVGFAS